MDDVLTGGTTIQETAELQQQLSNLLKEGQFSLRKWRSNDSHILANIKEEDTDDLLVLDKIEALKTLGLL